MTMRSAEFLNMSPDNKWTFTARNGQTMTLRKVLSSGDLDRWTVEVGGEEVGDIITHDRLRYTPRLSGGAVLSWVRSVPNAIYRIGEYLVPVS